MSHTTYHKDPLRPETVGAPDQAPQHPHQAGSSLTTYFLIFGALMLLLALTVWAATLPHQGSFNIVIWMSIAVIKALLVVLFFMHVIESTRLTKVFVFGTILWVMILFGFTFTDYYSRGWLAHSQGWDVNPSVVQEHEQDGLNHENAHAASTAEHSTNAASRPAGAIERTATPGHE